MGLFSILFRSDSDGETTKVRQDKSDNSHIRADKYEHSDDGKHTHESYDVHTSTGSYREYSGGKDSSDRGYNKK